jgi:hypothetical protein
LLLKLIHINCYYVIYMLTTPLTFS